MRVSVGLMDVGVAVGERVKGVKKKKKREKGRVAKKMRGGFG